jgi:hypothetical protein
MWSDQKNVTKIYIFINILYALCKTTVQLGVFRASLAEVIASEEY